MKSILRPFLSKFVLVFFVDILIYNKTWEEHSQHLVLVLGVLAEHKLFANKKKSEFGKRKVRYLGHKISVVGVEMDKEKIVAVMEWLEPKKF